MIDLNAEVVQWFTQPEPTELRYRERKLIRRPDALQFVVPDGSTVRYNVAEFFG